MLPKWFWLAALATILALVAACTLDNPVPNELSGPSELGTSIEMRAVPDTLVSDGFSSSSIEAVVRNASGDREAGRTIQFDITTAGAPPAPGVGVGFLDLGNLSPLNGARPVAGGVEAGPVSAVTGGDGVARVTYWAPFRTDQENDTTVQITGREASTNFANQTFRTVTIFLRAANRPSFPGTSTCGFIIEPRDEAYAVGDTIFFTATQINGANGHPIARYEWDFGDGSGRVEGRDTGHVYTFASSFTVTLFTTESVTGAQESCPETVEVTVSGAAPPPTPAVCPVPTAEFNISGVCAPGNVIPEASVIFFDAAASSAGTGTGISTYLWDFGDGMFDTLGVPTTTHTYAVGFALPPTGTAISIILTVTNTCGETATATLEQTVVAACP